MHHVTYPLLMSVHRIAGRYAKSLIELATEQGKLEEVRADVHQLEIATQSRDFVLMLASPIINSDKKSMILNAIFEGKVSPIMLGFMQILVNKGREPYLAAIATEFVAQYKVIKHISTVRLITATPATEATVAAVRQHLESDKMLESTIDLETSTNPDLIGGFILEYDNKRYDASIAYQLEQLRKAFKQNYYTATV